MQVQFDDITSGERLLRQGGKKEFVDDSCACDAYRALLFPGGMRGHNHTREPAIGSHWDLWAVVERANHLAFGTLLSLIGRQVQTRLNERMIEHPVFFATGHKGKACQVGEYRPGTILPIKPQKRTFLWELVCGQILTNGYETLSQFLPISAIPSVPETAEPTFNCAPVTPLCVS
jgi:hypothetical protein